MGRVRKAGMQQVRALERQIERLNAQRQELLADIGLSIGGGGAGAKRGRGRSAGRGRRSRVDWDQVFTKLPKTSFKASDVRALAPGVAAGTLSQRLTGWVEEKSLSGPARDAAPATRVLPEGRAPARMAGIGPRSEPAILPIPQHLAGHRVRRASALPRLVYSQWITSPGVS